MSLSTGSSARRIKAACCAAALLCLLACTRRVPGHVVPVAQDEIAASAAGQPSIYDLDVPLVESDGRAVTLSTLRGHTVVAAMFYSNCATVCPRITEDMRAVERALPEAQRGAITFALFSLDPGRDTPEVLRRFARERELGAAWRLFATSDEGVRMIAAALGVKSAPAANGEVAHSATIVVIDRDGVLRHSQVGLPGGAGALVRTAVSVTRQH